MVSNAKEFFDCASEIISGIKCIFVNMEEIHNCKGMLIDRWNNAQAVPGLQSKHCFKPSNNKLSLLVGRTSFSQLEKCSMTKDKVSYNDVYAETESSDCSDDEPIPSVSTDPLTPGQCVLVEYEGKKRTYKFVGMCQSEPDGEEVEIMFLKLHDKNNKRLFKVNEKDKCFVFIKQILKYLPEPVMKVVGNRVYYEFQKDIDVIEP